MKKIHLIIYVLCAIVVCEGGFLKKLNKDILNIQASLDNIKSDNELVHNTFLDKLSRLFLVYDVFDETGSLKMIRHGKENHGGYVVPEKALSKSDVLLGYGIAGDISFEEQFSDKYRKPSFGFDCGTENILIKNNLCKFVRECIANDQYVYSNQKKMGGVSTYDQQIKKLKLENKKVFIKMDIEGAEYEAFENIYNHAPNITGIVLEIHFTFSGEILKAINLLSRLKENFYLVHVHANNCVQCNFETKSVEGKISKVVELTFINKNLVTHAEISKNQKHPIALDMENCPQKKPYIFEIKNN